MRVMYLSATGELGGGERSLLDMIASLRARHPEWTLAVVTGTEGPLVERVRALGAQVRVLPFPASLSRLGEAGNERGVVQQFRRLAATVLPVLQYRASLRAVVSAFAPDIVHSNSLKMHVLGAWARSSSSALVWHLHDYIGSRPLTARLLRANLRSCAAIVCNSASVSADAAAVLGDTRPITVVLNGVDLQQFAPSGARLDLDALAGLPPAPARTVRVGLVGTFGRWKGHTTFLEALSKLPADLGVRGYIVGGALYQTDGSQHSLADLKQYAGSLGLNGRVGFTGFVPHPDQAMRALDIVVHASTAPEPFGLVVAEAMACERAVIVADAGGARELFEAGVDAVPHTPGDSHSLAASIAMLARQPDERRRLGAAGRQTATRRFDRARMADELMPVYERIAALAHA